MPLTRLLRLAPLAGLLAACAGGPGWIVPETVPPFYSPQELAYAGGGRDLDTVVFGQPFPGDKAAFDRAVAALMRGRHFGPVVNFTPTPGPSAREPYGVVLVFNPAVAVPNDALCRMTEVPTRRQPPGGRIALQAAFCRGGRMTSGLSGWLPAADSADDPRFRRFIADATMALFPPSQPDRDDRMGPGSLLFLLR